MTSGCGCTKARGMQCCEQFSPEYVTSARETCAEHTRSELDMAILGQLAAATNTSCTLPSGMLSTGRTHHAETEHERWYSSYFHQGKPVCQKMFRFLHGIGEKRLKNLAASFRINGIRPRTHGNAKKLPHNTISFTPLQYFVHFIFNYAKQHAFSQEEFQAIVVRTSNSFHQAIQNEPSGEVTSQQLKQMPPYVL